MGGGGRMHAEVENVELQYKVVVQIMVLETDFLDLNSSSLLLPQFSHP